MRPILAFGATALIAAAMPAIAVAGPAATEEYVLEFPGADTRGARDVVPRDPGPVSQGVLGERDDGRTTLAGLGSAALTSLLLVPASMVALVVVLRRRSGDSGGDR